MDPLSTIIDYLALQTTLVFITDEKRAAQLDNNSTKCGSLFVIEERGSLTIDEILNIFDDDTKRRHQFVLYCSIHCIKSILHKVNTHEHYHDEQGILTYWQRWFVLVENKTDLNGLQDRVANITNLSAMAINQHSEKHIVYSAMWKREGRLFEPCAYVENGQVVGNIFPNTGYGLNGRKLKVSTMEWEPFVIRSQERNGTWKYIGICMEILEVLASQMNLTFEIIEPPDGLWGDFENGSWNGFVKQMKDKTADMIMAPLSIQPFRASVMDFSIHPYYFEASAILYKSNSGDTGLRKYFLFLKPYAWPVWICAAIVIPLLGTVTHILSLYRWPVYHSAYSQNRKSSIADRIWETFGIMCAQGISNNGQKHIPYLVLLFWALTCLILSATYTGNLAAMLTVDVERRPFNNLEELISQEEYVYGTLGSTATTSIIKNSKGIYQDMWRRMKAWEKKNIPVLSPLDSEHLHLVNQGYYAYLGDLNGVQKLLNKGSRDLRMVIINNFQLRYCIGFQNNSAYKDIASKITISLRQNGLIERWEEKYVPSLTYNTKPSRAKSSPAISTQDLAGLFALFAAMLFLSVAILLSEMWASNQNPLQIPLVDKQNQPTIS